MDGVATQVRVERILFKGDDGRCSNKGESREDIIYFLLF